MTKQIGYAVVGPGDIARKAVLPAFAQAANNSRLVAIVSGDRAKAQPLADEFRAAPYHYDEFTGSGLQRDDVNTVYIALPNSMHCEYTLRQRARASTCSARHRWRSPPTSAVA